MLEQLAPIHNRQELCSPADANHWYVALLAVPVEILLELIPAYVRGVRIGVTVLTIHGRVDIGPTGEADEIEIIATGQVKPRFLPEHRLIIPAAEDFHFYRHDLSLPH